MEPIKVLPRGTRKAMQVKTKLQIPVFDLQYILNRIESDAILPGGINELNSAAMHLRLAIAKINDYNNKVNLIQQ